MLMSEICAQNAASLRSAIVWAMRLADMQDQTLIAAYLADALRLAEKLPNEDTR